MKISVIVPVYNGAEYLPCCLDSILAQTVKDLEIVIVNDGSTDATAELMEAYAARDGRIKAIHKDNGGVTSARLRGVAEATGECIGFVDGDDYIEPGMYELLLNNLQKYNADISHCGYQRVYQSRTDYYYNTQRLVVQEGIQGCTDLLQGRFVEPGLVNKLYRRELFEKLEERMDKSIRNTEDLLMNFLLFRQATRAVFEDQCPYHYMVRKNSACTAQLNIYKLEDPQKVLHLLEKETVGVPQWHQIVQRRLVYQLIISATRKAGSQRELVLPVRTAARKELRKRLGTVLTGNYGLKLKLRTLWAAIWPAGYGWAHRIYARWAGTDTKYEAE